MRYLLDSEIRRGIERLRPRDRAQAEVFERWLNELKQRFGAKILPVDGAIAEEWGRINAGSPVPVEDGLMAVSAKVHGMILVTRNVADVSRAGVELLIPGTAPRRAAPAMSRSTVRRAAGPPGTTCATTPAQRQSDLGAVDVKTPRYRHGSFEPGFVAKGQTRLAGLMTTGIRSRLSRDPPFDGGSLPQAPAHAGRTRQGTGPKARPWFVAREAPTPRFEDQLAGQAVSEVSLVVRAKPVEDFVIVNVLPDLDVATTM